MAVVAVDMVVVVVAAVEIVVRELVVGKIAVMAELLLKQVPMTRAALVVGGEALHLRVKVVTATADMGERRAELSAYSPASSSCWAAFCSTLISASAF
ncbi:hypothetical protein PMIT1313_00650 [Prochlorococcus marinus str. MIT 1313]|nr:hypothetical protein PMIT1313_00650 [Prochlorococcus marinus str. MIT 1313]